MKNLLLALYLLVFSIQSISQPIPIPAGPTLNASSYMLVDFNSGQILLQKNPKKRVEPASITKMMTAYAVFSALKSGSISMDDKVLISEKAWRMKGSKMFIEVGKKIKISALLKGMIIQSGNDASVALAEHVSGSEENFTIYMNDLAKKIGMTKSNFVNATGWPDKDHYTTASDVVILSKALIKEFPEQYKIFSEKKYTFNNISQFNRNKLLWRDKSVDGLKTGHTEAAGYCLASSAIRDGMRLISVIMGAKSEKSRTRESQKLIDYGFRFFDSKKLYSADEKIDDIKVWKGLVDKANLVLKEDLYIVIPRGQENLTKAEIEVPSSIVAPVDHQTNIGELLVTHNEKEIVRVKTYVQENIKKAGFMKSTLDSIKMYFQRFF